MSTAGYQALREGAAWLDLDGRGRFRARGEDRARLLHAMCTNHVQQMKPGDCCYAFFLNAQGRILSDAELVCLDEYILLDTEGAAHEELYQHLDKFIIADDVTLEDARQDTACLGVEGPGAEAVLAAFGGDSVARSTATMTGAPGGRLYVPAAEKADWIAKLETAGAVAASSEDGEAVRLENFRPRYGADILGKHLVQETQMLRAVHFSKGCYLGQEIVERVRSRGAVHRLLVPLYVEGSEVPPAGTQVNSGEDKAGDLMSGAYSPALGKVVAFAYVRSDKAQPGTALIVAGAAATVAAEKGR
jgi:folate-binding protein YgfZ